MNAKQKANEKVHYIASTTFTLDKGYSDLKAIGKGSYGVVCSAFSQFLGKKVAIKKITPMAKHVMDAKHVLREIRLMRHMGKHENIVTLQDLIVRESYDELYIVMELLDSDLHRIIQSKQELSENHFRHFFHQLLCGVKYLHDNRIIHRDLKPGNLLVTRDCRLRITDFGLARERPIGKGINPDDGIDEPMTEHVVTRWYRPPELMLCPDGMYTYAVDMWSCGCILAEMLGRNPLFPGKNFVHQLSLVFDVLGSPVEREIAHVTNFEARKFLKTQMNKRKAEFSQLYPRADKEAWLMLDLLLVFNPERRATVDMALSSAYLRGVGEPASLVFPPVSPEFEFSFESKNLTRLQLKALIQQEALSFKRERQAQLLQLQSAPQPANTNQAETAERQLKKVQSAGAMYNAHNDRSEQFQTSRTMARDAAELAAGISSTSLGRSASVPHLQGDTSRSQAHALSGHSAANPSAVTTAAANSAAPTAAAFSAHIGYHGSAQQQLSSTVAASNRLLPEKRHEDAESSSALGDDHYDQLFDRIYKKYRATEPESQLQALRAEDAMDVDHAEAPRVHVHPALLPQTNRPPSARHYQLNHSSAETDSTLEVTSSEGPRSARAVPRPGSSGARVAREAVGHSAGDEDAMNIEEFIDSMAKTGPATDSAAALPVRKSFQASNIADDNVRSSRADPRLSLTGSALQASVIPNTVFMSSARVYEEIRRSQDVSKLIRTSVHAPPVTVAEAPTSPRKSLLETYLSPKKLGNRNGMLSVRQAAASYEVDSPPDSPYEGMTLRSPDRRIKTSIIASAAPAAVVRPFPEATAPSRKGNEDERGKGKVTVPVSPKFSTMSWQRRHEGQARPVSEAVHQPRIPAVSGHASVQQEAKAPPPQVKEKPIPGYLQGTASSSLKTGPGRSVSAPRSGRR